MAGLHGFRSSLAMLEMQFEPLGVASGAASFTAGYRNVVCAGVGADSEPVVSTSAEDFYKQLWTSAINDLAEHATRLGADGVVGVTVSQTAAGPGWQLQLSGTAIRMASIAQLSVPFLSLLPMSSFFTLLAAGWVPSGIGWGVGALHVHGPDLYTGNVGFMNRSNYEIPAPTAAVNGARYRAEGALKASLRGSASHGAVGMTVGIQQQTQGCYYGGRRPGMLVVALALGTGVVRFGDSLLDIEAARQLAGAKSR